MPSHTPLSSAILPTGIRSRFIENNNGLTVHLLEAGFQETADNNSPRPTLLLLHGFPELAYSWRKIMQPLAEAGYHVLAPDQRGYGRTTGWDDAYDTDPAPFSIFNLLRDQLGLLAALGKSEVAAVIGHDFGSPVAAACALVRPDVFRSVALMSAPFGGAPTWPSHTALNSIQSGKPSLSLSNPDFNQSLSTLEPPRKHYQWYYSTREANADMHACPQGLHAFLRAYYHVKSADWPKNKPHPLAAWTAEALEVLPNYYLMQKDQGMAETVAPEMPSAEHIANCTWLPDNELAVYAGEYARTGFQGSLQWYRCATGGRSEADFKTFSGRTIDVPACFISGVSDWGTYQKPGDFEAMQTRACTNMTDCHLIEGAGHWVQQEQPEAVTGKLLKFLRR